MGGIVKGATGFVGHVLEGGAQDQVFASNYEEFRKEAYNAELDAADAEARGAILAGLARQRGSKLVAKQRVQYAAGGVDANVGTAADVQAETRTISELDAMTIRNNAMREALGHKKVAGNAREKQLQVIRQREAADQARILTLTGDAAEFTAGAMKLGGG